MLDPETFLVELDVCADEFCKSAAPPDRHPGPAAALARSARLTLALYGQWARFAAERDCWRYAERQLRGWFPTLPSRPQFNRQVRRQRDAIAACALWLAERLGAHEAPYEALDCTAVPVRNAKRRGRGWLAGLADIGFSKRRGHERPVGWYEGFCLLAASAPSGAVTGWGFGPASSNDRALAETLFAQRSALDPALGSAGQSASGVYVADAGFSGVDCERHWVAAHHAQLVAPPRGGSDRAWSRRAKRWLAGIRQVAETVFGRLQTTFRLERERPHEVAGLQARLGAKMALHNFCLWLNRQYGQPDLADVLGW